jgi:DNA-binding MarR family transcriptional regulator
MAAHEMSVRFGEQDYRDQADFRRALRTLLRSAEEQARAAGLTPQQYLLLLVTRGHASYPHVTIGDLVDALKLQQSTTSLLVARSVKRGLVRRDVDPSDRRKVTITVTDQGQAVLDRVVAAQRQTIDMLEDALFRDSLREALLRYALSSEPSL